MSTDMSASELMSKLTPTPPPGKPRSRKPPVKRQFHARQRETAERRAMREAEATLAGGMAAIFIAAAVRVLRLDHGWEPEALTTFGDRVLASATQMARELAAGDTGGATAAPPDERVD